MGALTSRQNAGVEEVDVSSNHAYKYPPRNGNYFGSHFIMGGERFDTPQPESYLFGENSDLNFLGSRPTSFPYPPPQANEPTKTLKSLVNIRKESLRFVRAPPEYNKIEGDHSDRDIEIGKGSLYNIEFTFDCDVRCAITIYYFCTEELTNTGVTYVPRDSSMNSETYHYKRGANQQFCQMSHCFDPSKYNEEELLFNAEKEIIPIAIHCIAEEGSDEVRQSHTTIAIIEKHSDGTYVLKALKQKLFVDGLCYLLQEIYGIENKNHDTKVTGDEDTEDNGSECVICMCDVRDTLILPCRHLCLCNSCADSLRYQANNCPICRAPFRALLQIRALQKSTGVVQVPPTSPPDASCDNIPPGYEAVSLIEALNGPCLPRAPPAAVLDLVETPDTEVAVAVAVQAAEVLNRGGGAASAPEGRDCKKDEKKGSTPEFRMSVLLSREEEPKETQKSPLLADQSGYRNSKNSRPRDIVRHVNEKQQSVDKDETQDEDSEAEKLSPLLHNKEHQKREGNNLALEMAGVVEPIDDTDTEHEDQSQENSIPVKNKVAKPLRQPHLQDQGQLDHLPRDDRADESDYYTPEDPPPTTLTNLNSLHSTPLKQLPVSHAHLQQSLPGTPLSHISATSGRSGDSYGSSSTVNSSRLLLVQPSQAGGGSMEGESKSGEI